MLSNELNDEDGGLIVVENVGVKVVVDVVVVDVVGRVGGGEGKDEGDDLIGG